ncbi:MAG: FAD-dependent monooxygenase, partial [Planctomycetes bacterium]|nr:FAD-dependent monooxygenase [Planctomycetota bacterium]
MTDLQVDVAIVGSGFGGSLTALLLERIGLRTVLIDRGQHPRLVLGESSTPLADMLLKSLSQKYGLPRIEPLAEYGTWQRTYPQLACGLKRGFSYFQHHPGRSFEPDSDHCNEL